MRDTDFNEWVSRLPQLSTSQRESLIKRLSILGHNLYNQPEYDYQDDWLLAGILLAFRRYNLISRSSLPRFYRSKGFTRYRQISGIVREELESKLQLILCDTKNDRAALAYLSGVCLIQLGARMGITSVDRIISSTDMTWKAIEDQFPGYYASGMFPSILRKAKLRAK